VSQNVAIALGTVIIILVSGLAGAIAIYTSTISGKDNTIASENSQISALQDQIASLNSQISALQSPVSVIPIENIIANPSAWVNKTVAVEGYLTICIPPGPPYPPFDHELSSSPIVSGSKVMADNGTCFPDTSAIGASGQNLGEFYTQVNDENNNKKVMVLGIVTTGTWNEMTENGIAPFGPPVYFIEAQYVIVL
jgi:hypothetical protein